MELESFKFTNKHCHLCQVELLSRAEEVARDSAEYRCLQSQFSVLYNESLVLKSQLDETKARLNTTRTARLRQLDHMEVHGMIMSMNSELNHVSIIIVSVK